MNEILSISFQKPKLAQLYRNMEIDQEYLHSLFTFYKNFYEINKPKLTELGKTNKSLNSQIKKIDDNYKKMKSVMAKKEEIIENQKKSIDQNHGLINKMSSQLDDYKVKYEKLSFVKKSIVFVCLLKGMLINLVLRISK